MPLPQLSTPEAATLVVEHLVNRHVPAGHVCASNVFLKHNIVKLLSLRREAKIATAITFGAVQEL
jgi:hypothetical protein